MIDDQDLDQAMKIFEFTDKMMVDERFLEQGFLEEKELERKQNMKSSKQDRAEGDGQDTARGGKKGHKGAAAAAQDDDDNSEEIDLEDFKDMRDIWRDFLIGKNPTSVKAEKSNV